MNKNDKETVVAMAPENEMNKDYEIKIEEMTDGQILNYLIEIRNLTKLDNRVESHKEPIITNKWVCCNCGSDSIQYSTNAWFDYNTDEFMDACDDIGREIWCGECSEFVHIIEHDCYSEFPKWTISSKDGVREFKEYDDFENYITDLEIDEKLETEILERFDGEQKDFFDYGAFTVQFILNDEIAE